MAAFEVGMKNMARLGSAWETLPRRLAALIVIISHPDSETAFSKSNWLEWVGSCGPAEMYSSEYTSSVDPVAQSILTKSNLRKADSGSPGYHNTF
jgi:hypothetical protein